MSATQRVSTSSSAASDTEDTSQRSIFCRSASLAKVFCPQHGVVGGASERLHGQVRELLQNRLLAVAGLMSAGSILILLWNRSLATMWLWPPLLTLALGAAASAFLYRQREFSEKTLRVLEILLFGFLLLTVSLGYLNFIAHASPEVGRIALYRMLITVIGILLLYGLFIPNGFIRSLLLTSGMASIPVLSALIILRHNPQLHPHLLDVIGLEHLSYGGLVLAVSALIASYGAQTIQSSREAAAEVAEMGMYQLKEKIGSGGMGEVWKAEHQMLARLAAIKIIRQEAIQGEDVSRGTSAERFKREAQITASLRSPHTVELYDFGVTNGGLCYYVMEYLEGLDLDALVERFGPQPAERVVHILTQAASSLSEAHDKGLIHRDIKPSNIHLGRMGSSDDFVKVLDFGLVKRVQKRSREDSKLSVDGLTTGTPAFMSPEMALGKGQVDRRSDVYGLGCVAYWLLTGELVFEGSSPMEVVVGHVKTEPTPPSQRTEISIPRDLEELIMKCLKKDVAERPQSLQEVTEALQAMELSEPWTPRRAADWWNAHFPPA